MLRKLYSFAQISFRRKILFIIAWLLSIYCWLLFHFFKQKARFSKKSLHPSHLTPKKLAISNDIRWAIFKANQYTLWENVCRHQAFQAKILLSFYQIPHQVFIGFKKSETGEIQGHAWSVVDNQQITGFCNADDYIIQNVY